MATRVWCRLIGVDPKGTCMSSRKSRGSRFWDASNAGVIWGRCLNSAQQQAVLPMNSDL